MEVTDAQGRVLLRRMLQEGEVHRFNTQPPYRVLLGKAQAAQVRVRGKDFDLEPHTRNSVARFEVQ
jgi:cytoskeleton protein RodZ